MSENPFHPGGPDPIGNSFRRGYGPKPQATIKIRSPASTEIPTPFAPAHAGASSHRPAKAEPRPDFSHLVATLADIDDAEERARFRREWGLVGIDENGRAGVSPGDGGRPEASMNAGITGRSIEEHAGHQPKWLNAELAAEAEAERRRKYLPIEDVREIIDAASFLVQLRGKLINSQITFIWALLGVDTDEAATKLLSDFTREFNMRFDNWGDPLDYIYVHERSSERGLHTHLIAYIPVFLRLRVTQWTKAFFGRRSVGGVAHPDAVKVQISGRRGLAGQLELHQHRVLYLCKGLDPEAADRDAEGRLKPLLELIGVPVVRRRAAGAVWSAQRRGSSRTLTATARKAGIPARSALAEKDWRGLWSGWELDEHRRRVERQQLEQVISRLRC